MVAPGQRDQVAAPIDDAFAEQIGRQASALQHVAGLQLDLADRGMALEAGALIENAVLVEQALGKGGGVVRIGMHDLVALHRQIGGLGENRQN